MSDKHPADQDCRDRIARELDKSFFVEAGAGSGKTRSLVDRMIALIRGGSTEIENIVAVTFTRKAAAELRERFQNEMEHLLASTGLEKTERTYLHKALANLEKTYIGTIHSFCAKLLRERPVEAGVDPGFEEIEEEDDTIYAKQVWSQYLEHERFSNNPLISWMQDKGVSVNDLEQSYIVRIRFNDVEAVKKEVDEPSFDDEKKKIKDFLHKMRNKMPQNEPENGWDNLQQLIVDSLRLIHFGYLNGNRRFILLMRFLCKKASVTLYKWEDVDAKACKDSFVRLQEDTVSLVLRRWEEYLHKPLMDFIEKGVDFYAKWRKERSLLNFQDLLSITAELLRENKEVRFYFKKRLKYLFIDEFQDTDPIQAEIIMLLTSLDNEESDWRKCKPKPGSLFVVGDPKQSIFRFRRADIDIYNQVKEIFKQDKGDLLQLTANFRSLPQIGTFVNETFKSIFTETDDSYQARFAPLNTIRQVEGKTLSGIIENTIDKIHGNKKEAVCKADAESVASFIKLGISGSYNLQRTSDERNSGLSEKPVPGDFMIITRKKANLTYYTQALEKYGIPYEISGGGGLSQSPELKALCILIEAVADPKSQVCLLAALRSLFYGISDDELYRFKRAQGKFSIYSKVPDGFSNIEKAFEQIKLFIKIVDTHTPIAALDKIIDMTGLVSLAVSLEAGSTRAGNILKAVKILGKFRSEQLGGFSELVENLKMLLENIDIEQMSLFPETSRVVRIMNLHKAKGLESPVVFLVDPLGSVKDHEPELHVKRTSDGSKGYFVIRKPISTFGQGIDLALPGEWSDYAAEEDSYNEAEKRRLEYVAATRAKNLLVVSTYHHTKKETTWQAFNAELSDQKKLEVEQKIDILPRTKVAVSSADFKKGKDSIAQRLLNISRNSYNVVSVTSLAKEDSSFIQRGASAGTVWGSVMHKALELCGRGEREKLGLLLPAWLASEQHQFIEKDKVFEVIDRIVNSDFWKAMQKSSEKYFEIPFSINTDEGVLSGQIDLVYKEQGEWVIIDYKTDNFEEDPKRKKAYQKQLDIYAKYWQELTKERVKEKILYQVK